MRGHVITAATALSLGVGAGATFDDLAVKPALSKPHRVTVQGHDVPNDDGTIDALWRLAESAVCAEPDAPEGCAVEPGAVVSLTRGEDLTTLSATFRFAGVWLKGAPD